MQGSPAHPNHIRGIVRQRQNERHKAADAKIVLHSQRTRGTHFVPEIGRFKAGKQLLGHFRKLISTGQDLWKGEEITYQPDSVSLMSGEALHSSKRSIMGKLLRQICKCITSSKLRPRQPSQDKTRCRIISHTNLGLKTLLSHNTISTKLYN
jgi:hypothetical protein